MKIGKRLTAAAGLAVLASGSLMAQAVTRTLQFQSENTTSFGSAPFNFSGDGVANYAWFNGNSDLGKILGQGISQSAPTGKSCLMPDGVQGIELKLVDHVAVTRFERSGDLLYERGRPGDLQACLNLQNGTFRETGKVQIIGGTGRFKNATGFYTAVQDGQILVPPGSDKLQFGFATATYNYTLTLPPTTARNGGAQIEASIAGPKNISVNGRSVQLDGSASKSADGKELSYQWSFANEAAGATIEGDDTATPTVRFPRKHGKHMLQLTVTDSEGNSSTDFVLISNTAANQ